MGMWNWGKGKKSPKISTIVEVDSDRVSCNGVANDHPVTLCSCVRVLQKQKRWTNTSMVQHTQRTE